MHILASCEHIIGIYDKWLRLLLLVLVAYKHNNNIIQSNNNKHIAPFPFERSDLTDKAQLLFILVVQALIKPNRQACLGWKF